jgi:hypothetical protein
LRDDPDRAIEQPDEDDEGREPVAKVGQLAIVGIRGGCRCGFPGLLLEDGDDRVAFADLALRDDPAEPLEVVADR